MDSRGRLSPHCFMTIAQRLQIALGCSIANALYWIHPAKRPGTQIHHTEGLERMTYLDVVFNYASLPGENELRAIDSMREGYGIQRARFNEKERPVRVQFDASRLKQDAVAKVVPQAGIDLREPVALA